MFLALVCIIRSENFEKQGLIDYNFQCFKDVSPEMSRSIFQLLLLLLLF